jgi:MFS family permease
MLRESLDLLFLGIAGVVVSLWGAAPTLLITTFCFLITAVIYTLFKMKKSESTENPDSPNDRVNVYTLMKDYKRNLTEGISLVKNSVLPHIIIAAVIANFFTGGMFAALPAFSIDKGGESFYGFFMVAMTLGLLTGSFLAPKITRMAYGKLSILAAFLSGSCFTMASLLSSFYSVLFYGLGFIFTSIISVFIFSSIQQTVESNMIGRIVTLVSSFASFSIPLGALFGGAVAQQLGSLYAILFGGLGMLGYSVYWIIHPTLRKLPKVSEINFFQAKDEPHRELG